MEHFQSTINIRVGGVREKKVTKREWAEGERTWNEEDEIGEKKRRGKLRRKVKKERWKVI